MYNQLRLNELGGYTQFSNTKLDMAKLYTATSNHGKEIEAVVLFIKREPIHYEPASLRQKNMNIWRSQQSINIV